MSETVLNAAGTSAAGTVAGAPTRTLNMKWFGYLYMFFGICLLIIGNIFIAYPGAYKGSYTFASSYDTTAAALISVVAIIILIFGYLDFQGTKTSSTKLYIPAILFVMGIILLPLYTDYGAFNGLLGNSYNLSGISMGGFLLIFASLGEIALLRKK